MKNLLNFFLKYNYWFIFVLLEIVSFALLFRFNSYQGSALFTSANFVSGAMYDAANNVTGYFHLKTINDELVQKNVGAWRATFSSICSSLPLNPN